MKSRAMIQTVALVALGFPVGSLSRNCLTNPTEPAEGQALIELGVSSQTDLEHLAGCTNLTGDIMFSANYSGPFSLNGVTDFTGRIVMDRSVYSEDITSFEMLDVLNFNGEVNLREVPEVRLPMVQYMEKLHLSSSQDGLVEADALVEAGFVSLEGSWSSVKLGSLKNVSYSLRVCSNVNCSMDDSTHATRRDVIKAASVDFPALESAGYIGINGTVSSFSMPRLQSIGGAQAIPYEQGFDFVVDGPALELDFPEIHSVSDYFLVMGSVSRVEWGLLGLAWAPIYIHTTVPADIAFLNLAAAATMDFHGAINSIEAPELVNLEELHITSSIVVHCDHAVSIIQGKLSDTTYELGICGGPSKPTPTPSPSPSFYASPSPSSTPTSGPSQKELSTGAIAGIVFAGFSALVGFAIVRSTVLRKRGRKTDCVANNVRSSAPRSDVRVGTGRPDNAACPAYSDNGGSGSEAPEEVEDGPPPPYSRRPMPSERIVTG